MEMAYWVFQSPYYSKTDSFNYPPNPPNPNHLSPENFNSSPSVMDFQHLTTTNFDFSNYQQKSYLKNHYSSTIPPKQPDPYVSVPMADFNRSQVYIPPLQQWTNQLPAYLDELPILQAKFQNILDQSSRCDTLVQTITDDIRILEDRQLDNTFQLEEMHTVHVEEVFVELPVREDGDDSIAYGVKFDDDYDHLADYEVFDDNATIANFIHASLIDNRKFSISDSNWELETTYSSDLEVSRVYANQVFAKLSVCDKVFDLEGKQFYASDVFDELTERVESVDLVADKVIYDDYVSDEEIISENYCDITCGPSLFDELPLREDSDHHVGMGVLYDVYDDDVHSSFVSPANNIQGYEESQVEVPSNLTHSIDYNKKAGNKLLNSDSPEDISITQMDCDITKWLSSSPLDSLNPSAVKWLKSASKALLMTLNKECVQTSKVVFKLKDNTQVKTHQKLTLHSMVAECGWDMEDCVKLMMLDIDSVDKSISNLHFRKSATPLLQDNIWAAQKLYALAGDVGIIGTVVLRQAQSDSLHDNSKWSMGDSEMKNTSFVHLTWTDAEKGSHETFQEMLVINPEPDSDTHQITKLILIHGLLIDFKLEASHMGNHRDAYNHPWNPGIMYLFEFFSVHKIMHITYCLQHFMHDRSLRAMHFNWFTWIITFDPGIQHSKVATFITFLQKHSKSVPLVHFLAASHTCNTCSS